MAKLHGASMRGHDPALSWGDNWPRSAKPYARPQARTAVRAQTLPFYAEDATSVPA
jgi:hypothetical protein